MTKTKIRIITCLLTIFCLFACQSEHFIEDKTYRKQVRQDFEKKEKELPQGDLFRIFRQKLSTPEREALMFLYAYMPVGDITDYPGEYHLENIRLSQKAKEEMPWGKTIPEELFRHFVLPVRANNENLDHSRQVFYAELKERIKGMSLYDAVLEINHWCHEKVTYTSSDARTTSPLASVKSAFGRCGEESTFTVAALRSVCIPARQVYTPRWAHTDDNHAWVEAWIDGKWYFFGACEPEPVLNLGWFNATAGRGMLMHAKVFGRYEGKEEIMLQTPNYTEINLMDNYAPTGKATIQVTNMDGRPVENAKVEFKVYNYAELHTVATRYTDETGSTSLSAGKGDMVVWASKDGAFGYAKLSFGKTDRLNLVLDRKADENYSIPLDIVPPPEYDNTPEVTPGQREENNRRLAQEDSIRNAYQATFMNKERAAEFIRNYNLPEKAERFLTASRGNWNTLTAFLIEADQKKATEKTIGLLAAVSEKDLRDVSAEVLNDHLYHTPQEIADTVLFNTCVLNPRVRNEMITSYKQFFREAISASDREAFKADPHKLIEWCKEHIRIKNELNSLNITISPKGVWQSRTADTNSRNVFFVSLARSLGIPAWIDNITGKIQYTCFSRDFPGGQTLDVNFEQTQSVKAPTGILKLRYEPSPAVADPKYYSHFTLSRFRDGAFRLLNYDEGEVDMGGGTSWARRFKNGITLDTGYYMLVSGIRLPDGTALSQLTFFSIEEGQTRTVDLVIRENKRETINIIGRFDTASTYLPLSGNTAANIAGEAGYGYYILGILGVGQEPTNHALRDIAALGSDFEKQGQKIVLLFPDKEQSAKFNPSDFPGLPSTIRYGIDENDLIRKQLLQVAKLSNGSLLPLFIIGNRSNEIVFVSQGYTIGLGEQLMKEMNLLK